MSTPEDPKGIAGLAKPQLQLIPPGINTAMAAALKIGADKYGPWNWRTNKVEIMTYLGAMRRHIDAVLEGEDLDPESGAHHLGHVAAGCAIVLDALAHGTLIDNRPPAHVKETEIDFDPNNELAEFLGARKKLRDAEEKHESDMAKLRAVASKDPVNQEMKKSIWGSLFAKDPDSALVSVEKQVTEKVIAERPINLDELEGPIKGKAKGYQRPILIADEQVPVNLDALASHIDEVVNEFPTEPLDPHA